MSFNANSPDSYNSNSKALAQRQYREKEGEGFEELQLAVHQVTGGRAIPETRHEILTKAAEQIRELHRFNMELRRQLMAMSNPSSGAPGGQGGGVGPGGGAGNHYAGSTASGWGNYNMGGHV